MKNDFSFKLIAAVILAGVVIAFASPSLDSHHAVSAKPVHATATAADVTE